MTTPLLFTDLEHFEGCRLTAYWDPIGRCWTIGYGHTGPEVHEGLVWTQVQADRQLVADATAAALHLDADPATRTWWRALDGVRQDGLVEMAFQLGERTLDGFHRLLADVRAGAWARAHADALASRWNEEVPRRAAYVAAMLETGARPAAYP